MRTADIAAITQRPYGTLTARVNAVGFDGIQFLFSRSAIYPFALRPKKIKGDRKCGRPCCDKIVSLN
jgi:hypothetical protein